MNNLTIATYTHTQKKTKWSTKHSPFLLKVLRCIVIINQSFTIKLKWPIETNSSETILPLLIKTGVAGVGDNIHLAFRAFWADLVTLPAPAAFLSPALMTPTATACLMSRTAKWPRGGWSEKLSMHMGLPGTISTMAASRFQKLWAISRLFLRTTINLLLQLSECASNMSCVTTQNRCRSSTDLAWMVKDNHLSCEASCFHWWVIFAINSLTNIFDRHVLDIEANIVPRKSSTQSFMVHFNRLYFSCNIGWSKGDHHARFENTSLHSAHRDSTNATNFVDILEGQTQGSVR